MSYEYNDPNFLLIRTQAFNGSISTAALTSAYIGASLKVYTKCLVLGCMARVGSVSASGTNTLSIAKTDVSGTILSTYGAFSFASAAAGNEREMSLTTGFTVSSIGEAAVLTGNAASLDKVPVLQDVIWRYRILPMPIPITAALG